MRFFSVATLTLALLCAPLYAQQPPAKGVDEIAGKISDIDKQTAELAKQRSALVGDLKTELNRIADVVAKLNLSAPVPPPSPVVPPPPPADPLKAKLKAAFDADPAAPDARKGQALDLAALYRQAATLAADTSVLSAGDLLARVRDAAKALVGADALKGVRAAASGELGALLPTDAPLTDEQRKGVAALFLKLAAALEEIAK